MKSETFTFESSDNQNIYVYKWLPDDPSKITGAIQIAHGIAEHGPRYERFASYATGKGIAVYINDHRGHGKTAASPEEFGFFAEENGWDKCIDDMHTLTLKIKENHPGKPVFLLGHSMGSFMARKYITKYAKDLKGLLLSGTGQNATIERKAAMMLAKREMKKKGAKTESPFLDKLLVAPFNKKIKPLRTNLDWLTTDEAEVDKYIADPYCGFICTSSLYNDLLTGVDFISNIKNLKTVPLDLPIYLYSGELDPVGYYTKGVMKVYNMYKKLGIKDVTYKFYKNARHEVLNESCKDEVHEDIINWLKAHM